MSASEAQDEDSSQTEPTAKETQNEQSQEAEKADFEELEQSGDAKPVAPPKDVDLNLILDVDITLELEVGRTNMSVRDLLQLNQGSVVELDRLAGEPLDVLVNGTLVAHGDVVVVNNNYGIRLTDVISPSERIKKVNE